MSTPADTNPIPFSFFCSLIREVSKLRPVASKARSKRPTNHLDYPALHIFRRWMGELHRRFEPLPPHTTSVCFRLLFPEEDVHRKYDIQETRMTTLLADCFGIDIKTFERWSLEEATGCLGQELRIVLERTCSYENDYVSPLTIHEIDALLDELASKSGFTHATIRAKYEHRRRPRNAIFRSLFRQLSPEDASILVQIILKDLRPILYPLTEFHYTTALTRFNTTSVKMFSKEHAMDIWDSSGMFLRFYRVCADIDEAANVADLPPTLKSIQCVKPTLGKPVAIPKSEKGRSCEHALSFLAGSEQAWAETKYDGERAQIHVQVDENGASRITIFSKSRRDSTMDRRAVHNIIRAALSLDGTCRREHPWGRVHQNVILDAEMVAFRGETVDEFWRIRQLIGDTAYGIRRGNRRYATENEQVQESMDSLANEGLSLGLVFFDVLFLDSESLLPRPYKERRELLEYLIERTPGKAILAQRYPIDMTKKDPSRVLCKIFAEHIASCKEGLVLKADDSRYNDYKQPWVKVKRDYLPEAGDKLDVVILGASWEKVRGRSLRVPPTTYTTFYVGGVENARDHVIHSAMPRFQAYFTVSYGLNRDDLERINFFIKSSDTVPYTGLCDDLPFMVEVFSGLKPLPMVILKHPLLVSLYGAGFTKAPQSRYYELRFPRITKYYLPTERKWQESSTLEEIHKIALDSIGRDRPDKDIFDWANLTWGKLVSPRADSSAKRQVTAEYWEKKLTQMNGKTVVPDVQVTPTRRKRTENDGAQDGGASVRPKRNSQPLSVTTNVTPPRTPVQARLPWEVISDKALVWFAQQTGQLCPSMASWKKHVPRERRLHSLDSLLQGCGSSSGVQGVIVLDECDEKKDRWMAHVRERGAGFIVVYGCRSGLLKLT